MSNFKVLEVMKEKDIEVYLSPISTDTKAIELYTKWMNDKAINRMLGRTGKIVTFEEQLEWARKQAGKPSFNIIYVEGVNEKLIGNCSIVLTGATSHIGILGINIGDKNYHNKGIGTYIVKSLLDYAFNELNLNTMSLTVSAENKGAIKCYEKAGFIKQGIQRNTDYFDGKYHNSIYMDITKEEYINKGE